MANDLKPRRTSPAHRTKSTWTQANCPTPRGTTPKHKVGRPIGSTNLAPIGTAKAAALPRDTIAGLFKYIGAHEPHLYYRAIERGLAAGGARSFPFVSLAAAYMDGKPVERLLIQADSRLLFVTQTGSAAPAVPQLGGPDDDSEVEEP